ncbi:DNA replication protein DnaD [Lactiplantibacillus pentosus]|uniref:DNA replication protein DnaD n=1 Tax=Lactiplantibacillus pentosus TaxID=1589 RepID=UPI00376FE888
MDYFKQRRAYRNFKMYEASVSNGQNNLYRELLDYANDEGKLDVQFRMKNSALLSLTGLSEPGLDKARNSLVQLGLIKYVRGKKNVKPPEYRIINLYSRSAGYPTSNPTTSHKSRPTGLDKVGQLVGQGGGQPVEHKELTSTDLNLTDTDKKNIDPRIRIREDFQNEVWAIYPRQEKFGDAWNAYYRATITGSNPAGKATKGQIIQGIGNYKRYLEVKGIQGQYVQQLANWLDNGGWLSNYDMTPPVQPVATSGGQASREAQTYVRNDF